MASSTSNDLKLELITTGEKSGTWGTITNTNLQILEQIIGGYSAKSIAASTWSTFAVNSAYSSMIEFLYFMNLGAS